MSLFMRLVEDTRWPKSWQNRGLLVMRDSWEYVRLSMVNISALGGVSNSILIKI
jgi:hypothetical protein